MCVRGVRAWRGCGYYEVCIRNHEVMHRLDVVMYVCKTGFKRQRQGMREEVVAPARDI